jgi:hypothetical protein
MKDIIIRVIRLFNLIPSQGDNMVIERAEIGFYFSQVGVQLKNGIKRYESQAKQGSC